jgi:hypothetical protein
MPPQAKFFGSYVAEIFIQGGELALTASSTGL